MAAARGTRTSFGVLFTLYAAGLLIWLTLGLLPTLSATLRFVRHGLESVAMQGGALGAAADRIMSADVSMSTMSMSTAGVLVQYGFSALNFGLGLMLAVRRPDELVPRLLAFALLGTAATFNQPSHMAFYITGSPWPIAIMHFTFHIVSGVSYLWAVLLFPDGTAPSRVRMSARGQRAAAVAVTLVVTLVCWRSSFLAHPQFFVIFFGILIPVVGIGAQALRLADPTAGVLHRRAARLLTAALLPALGVAVTWLAARAVRWVGGRGRGTAGRQHARSVPGRLRHRSCGAVRRRRPSSAVGHRPSVEPGVGIWRDRGGGQRGLRSGSSFRWLACRWRSVVLRAGALCNGRRDRADSHPSQTLVESNSVRPGPEPERGDTHADPRPRTPATERRIGPAGRGDCPGNPRTAGRTMALGRR